MDLYRLVPEFRLQLHTNVDIRFYTVLDQQQLTNSYEVSTSINKTNTAVLTGY